MYGGVPEMQLLLSLLVSVFPRVYKRTSRLKSSIEDVEVW